ncbi:hypothetical protein L6452_15368 [Arctium lappa]|uniref:Uncharacterized protein n=1 Tax=Arctium lappa TaxID=4217 RepID=A0ACB9CNC8_ARCLA|nr:hypothetical protein L6452_15368 [Arctium lappa]
MIQRFSRLSGQQMVDLITGVKAYQWKSLFRRLDWEGNFPTSVTNPQPMGKDWAGYDRFITVMPNTLAAVSEGIYVKLQ